MKKQTYLIGIVIEDLWLRTKLFHDQVKCFFVVMENTVVQQREPVVFALKEFLWSHLSNPLKQYLQLRVILGLVGGEEIL